MNKSYYANRINLVQNGHATSNNNEIDNHIKQAVAEDMAYWILLQLTFGVRANSLGLSGSTTIG